MPSIEDNSDDWREIRSRVDSIANAVFLISGGTLSLSITVLLGNTKLITSDVFQLATTSWYLLLSSTLIFLLLKGHLVLQAYLLQFKTDFLNRNLRLLNGIGWAMGIIGFISFSTGMFVMVQAAVVSINWASA